MAKISRKIWIAGAGYLGAALADELTEQHYDVCASSRHALPASWWRAWDVQDVTRVADFQVADVWVVLLPPSAATDYVRQMQTLCQQAQRLAIKQLVFASSTSVYGNRVRLCTEATECEAQTESAKKLVAVEDIWLNSQLHQVNIMRLGGLFDDVRHPVHRLSGRHNLTGRLHPVNVVHKHQAVQALQAVIEQPLAHIINVVQSQHPTRMDFYTAEAQRLNIAPPNFDEDDNSSGKIVDSQYTYWSY